MRKGSKICADCLIKEQQAKDSQQATDEMNKRDREELNKYLLYLFPEHGNIPESWDELINSLVIYQKLSYRKILETLQYCTEIVGKKLFEETWSSAIRTYAREANEYWRDVRRVQAINEKHKFKQEVRTVQVHDTTYRDMPPYNIEDL